MALASSLTVIGWVAQVMLDQGITFAIDHWRCAEAGPNLPLALESLREAINNVRALLPIAQMIRSENEGLLQSVKDLKDAAYDAEDILSELDYYRLQEEFEGKANSNNSSIVSSMIEAAGGFLSQLLLTNEENQASTSSLPPSVVDNKVAIIPRIYEVVGRLDRIITGVSRVLALLKPEGDFHADSHESPMASHLVTTSFLSSKQTMFGREDTKGHIIDLLLNGQPAATSEVCVLPIIGVGGIGKTTLARVVYNDKRVEKHFDCRLWLYVSDNFDVPRLTREMLESFGVQGSSHIKNLDQLQRLLMENLCSKKFLLVLDDVWNDADRQKWDTICGPFEFGKPGSRILMTTRLDTVVRMVGKTMDVLDCSIKLKGLPKEEYLSLFNKCAFGDKEPGDYSNLAEIGKQIAGKLEGSPLAAKTVGSFLSENLDVDHWRSILWSDIWKLPQRHDDIMPVLKLSYQHLPVHLQQCFAYSCVFPKGRKFEAQELVRMWIAHGYIDTKTSGNKRLEDIGWEYFNILLARSFFQLIEVDGNIDSHYIVHDLFHDLARSVSADECFIIDTNNQKIPRRVRHLYLSSDHMALVLKKSYLRNLRTLIIHGVPFHNYHVLEELLQGLKSVRVLCYFGPLKQLPHNIGHLIHLRYLYLQPDRYARYRVPDSWCKLYHLQHFIGRLKSLTFPSCTLNLVNLRRFCFDKRVGIENLTCLQELDCFIIKEGRKIGELKKLNELGGSLRLENLENVYTREEASEAELSKKMYLRNLLLKCEDSQTSPAVAEEVFEGIRPPAYIKELVIEGYGGVKTPTWMLHEYSCLSYLQSLSLLKCLKWKDLPPFGQLPFLRHLKIDKAEAVEVIGRGFYGAGDAKGFQCLETLEFRRMPQLVVWSGIGEDHCFLFPRLGELTIMDCPKLEQVPMKDLTFLKSLITNYMPLLVHPENLPSLKTLAICECEELLLPPSLEELCITDTQLLTLFTTEQAKTMSNLRSLYIRCPQLMSMELKSLPSLKKVSIVYSNRLLSLPLLPPSLEVLELVGLKLLTDLTMEQEEKLSDLTSLRQLNILYCHHLNSLPLLPASLEELRIFGCPELTRERYQKGSDESNNVSHVPKIFWA